jgi:hypothetical protein
MGTRRHYIRLSPAEFEGLPPTAREAQEVLDALFWHGRELSAGRVLPAGEERAHDLDKMWMELDVVLGGAGFSIDDVNGTDHIRPADPRAIDREVWPYLSEIERRMFLPSTYLPPAAVRDLVTRWSSMDFGAAYDAVEQRISSEVLYGPTWPDYRASVVEVCEGVREFFRTAADAGDVVVSVMR